VFFFGGNYATTSGILSLFQSVFCIDFSLESIRVPVDSCLSFYLP